MSKSSVTPKTLVDAVQQVFGALEPFDDAARRRIIDSVASLLGMAATPKYADSAMRLAEPPSPHVSEQSAPPAAPRRLSPVELLQEKNPTTNAQKIALFAYYREKVEGLARFSRADLESYFAKAKEPPPGNYHRDFQAALSLGWIYEDGADSYLTTKGLEAVEAGFGGKARPRGSSASKQAGVKRASRKSAKANKKKRT
jgi:hypothetical protein